MVRAAWLASVAAVLAAAVVAQEAGAQDDEAHTFVQWVRRGAGARRLFGGRARSSSWSAACALQNQRREPSCSCAVVAPRWALTAAHCVPGASFVHYNAEHAQRGGDTAAVAALYLHPRYHVTVQEVAGVPEVRELHHDVGLLRTTHPMHLAHSPYPPPLEAIRMYSPDVLINSKLEVLGFGKWEGGEAGESLRGASITAVRCGRSSWRACVCGAGAGGVCAGDSGGPVLLGEALVALASLGPVYCAAGAQEEHAAPVSVLTTLQPYADLVEATVAEDWSRPRMTQLQRAASPRRNASAALPPPLLALLLAALLAAAYPPLDTHTERGAPRSPHLL